MTAAVPGLAEWEALGTTAVLVVADERNLSSARAIVEHELQALDLACSRFRDDSDLARANANAGRVVKVQPLLVEAVEVALRAARLTDGDLDPTVGLALELAGYDRDWDLLEKLPQPDELSGARPEGSRPKISVRTKPGWQAVELNSRHSTIRIPLGVKLDLGATAKAWVADRAGQAVFEATGCGTLLSLGGDISVAGPSPSGGWQVHVTDDHRDGLSAPGQRVVIRGGGLATSSTTARRWRHEGQAMHHIIDPRTGHPVSSPWRTVSVAAINCVDANIASTAALLRGDDGPRWLAELGMPARLVGQDGEVLTVGSWPEQEQGEPGYPPTYRPTSDGGEQLR